MISFNTVVFPLATLDCSFLAGQQVLGILPCKFYLSSGLWILTIIPAFSHGSGKFKFRSTLMQMAFHQWSHLQLSLYEGFNTTMCHLSYLSCSRKVFLPYKQYFTFNLCQFGYIHHVDNKMMRLYYPLVMVTIM